MVKKQAANKGKSRSIKNQDKNVIKN